MKAEDGMAAPKVAVVSGATSGIGLATARALVGQRFRIIAMGRHSGRVSAADAELRAGAEGAEIDWVIADFSRLADVRRAAGDIVRLTGHIDVLVNNAGLLLDRRSTTEQGFETTFAVNHLAPFLLTTSLLPLLKAAPAHVINVSSVGHTMIDDMRWDDLQMERDFAPLAAYAQSKLANVLFTRELARRFDGEGLVASAVHPGLVASRFPLTGGADTRAYYAAAQASGEALTSEQGADTVVWLATAPGAALPSGGYFAERRRIAPSAAGQDDDGARRLWTISERLVGQA